jgi:hypothetical protein
LKARKPENSFVFPAWCNIANSRRELRVECRSEAGAFQIPFQFRERLIMDPISDNACRNIIAISSKFSRFDNSVQILNVGSRQRYL